MFRRAPFIALLSLAVLLGAGVSSVRPASATPAITGYPNSIAATGDSITQAVDSSALFENPENSWATGTNPAVNSVYSRILALNPAIATYRFNDSVSGARMVDLNGQALNAVAQGAELVTVLMGANDVCTSSEATMTPVATFRSQLEQAMATLSAGLPDARIAVASVPDIYNLWAILKDNSSARFMWGTFGICQSMLANPQSTAQADVDRRAAVRQRNIDFNTQLAEVCAQYVHCRFDNDAAFNLSFTPADVSTIDYFHPSVAGQTLAATVAWAIYDLTDNVTPVSALTAAPVPGGQSVSLSATDNAGVSGIEYKLNGGPYQRYAGPISLVAGDTLTYRAVDVSGNSEATRGFPPKRGDIDCDGVVTSVDAILLLRYVAHLPIDLGTGCPPIDAVAAATGVSISTPLARGDIDCDGMITAVDALFLLRYVAQLDASVEGCPSPVPPAGQF